MERNNLNNTEIKDQIYSEIRKEFKDKFDKDITINDIKKVITFQFRNVKEAIENKETIEVKYLGVFAIKEGREDYLRYKEELDCLNLTEEEVRIKLKARAKDILINKRKEK